MTEPFYIPPSGMTKLDTMAFDHPDDEKEFVKLQDEHNFRVIFCGGRDYNNHRLIIVSLLKVAIKKGELDLIHGDARGADRLADAAANLLNPMCLWSIRIIKYPADWNKYGKSAGFKRNAQMLNEGRAQAVVAFKGGKGTQNMMNLAKKAGIPVWEVPEREVSDDEYNAVTEEAATKIRKTDGKDNYFTYEL
jgi:hypothetical protein